MLSPVLEHHEKWYYSYQRKKPSEKLLANLDKEKITKFTCREGFILVVVSFQSLNIIAMKNGTQIH